ncbi:MAG: hypothetical protein ACRCTS_09010 [Fusobacteriaceae bacterium]
MKGKREEKYSKEYADRCMDEIIKKVRSQDYSEAVDDSRLMLEMLIRDLSEKSGLKYMDGNLKKSFENLKVEMQLASGNNRELEKVIEGLSLVIYGIDEIESTHITKDEAKLYLSSSVIVSEFLLERYLELGKNRVWS